MQSSLAVQRCMLAASTSCVCLFGSYCNVYVHMRRADLVWQSVYHDCRSPLAAQLFW